MLNMLWNKVCTSFQVKNFGLVLIVITLQQDTVCCHSRQSIPQREAIPQADALPPERNITRVMPTVMFPCSTEFVLYLTQSDQSRSTFTPQDMAQTVMGYIQALCSNETRYGESFVRCVQANLPVSPHPVDQLLTSTFNLTAIPQVLAGGCSYLKELNSSLECIISGVMANPMSVPCLTDVGAFFDELIASGVTTITSFHTENFCNIWGTMVTCIAPYLAACNEVLTGVWSQYGAQILSPTCRQQAFAKSGEVLQVEDSSDDIFELFSSNSSALMMCANEYSKDMIQFMPTAIFNHSVHPSEAVIAFNAVCGDPIQSFMYCLDERRLNASSAVDTFMFQIISTVNMRVAYNKMCSQLGVLRDNINCLLNSAVELKMCSCYLSEMLQITAELAHRPQGFLYGEIVEPFCGYYVSFSKCYLALIDSCSPDLSRLMADVYLGALTSSCLKAKSKPCLPGGLTAHDHGGPSSGFVQCGAQVSKFVEDATRDSNSTFQMDVMLDDMEEMVISAYQYTCSVGDDILKCLREHYLWSKDPFDRLLKMMFDITKFQAILTDGCRSSLIQDLSLRLKFILSNLFSDPRTSSCIDGLYKFQDVLAGDVDMDIPDAAEPYCRIWADFSECIESKLACSSPQLAVKWRQFSIESMTVPCYNISLSQQALNQYQPMCDMHPVDDSVVTVCGMRYMTTYLQRRRASVHRVAAQLHEILLGEIDHFCARDHTEAFKMIACLRTSVPTSFLGLDRVVNKVFNLSRLDDVALTACSLQPVLEQQMECIVEAVKKSAGGGNACIHHLMNGFNVTLIPHTNIKQLASAACSGWNKFVTCIHPLLKSCHHGLATSWKDLSNKLLSESCRDQITPVSRSSLGGNAPHLHEHMPQLMMIMVLVGWILR